MTVLESLNPYGFVNDDELMASSNGMLTQLVKGQGKKSRTGTGPLKPYRHEDLAWAMYQKRWDFEKDPGQ